MSDQFPPPLSCDCHAHVIGPKSRYPLASPRAYTPMDAPVEMLEAMLDRLGLARIVLIQPSVFGTDNTCMLDAMARLEDRARGVAVLADDVGTDELDRLDRANIRGIRVNIATLGQSDIERTRERLRSAAKQCARNGWHVQLFAPAAIIHALGDELAALPVPVMLDHFGLLSPAEPGSAAEATILKLLESGRAWVKISGTYRLSPPDLGPAVTALARRLYDTNPERIVWGSDWPHSPPHPAGAVAGDVEQPYRDLDTTALLDTIRQWFEEPRQWRQILADNPARLYGF